MLVSRPNDLVLGYTRLMMGFLLFSPNPRHIAMVGLGGGSLAKFCYRHLPDACIQVLEINPYVIALRNEFEVPRDDHRFSVRKEDAAAYMRTAPYRYNVIVADGFDANEIPPNLCSSAFYDDCFDKLGPAGVLVANLHANHADFLLHVQRMRNSFRGNLMTIDDLECNNVVAFAFKESSMEMLSANLERCASSLPVEAWDQLCASFTRIRKFGRLHN